jgi:site-specific DNA-methyltransferase (adenine-specific)
VVDVMKLPARNGEIWLGDCLELMKDIPSGSVDMILCDLPYGTTDCAWDSVVPFAPLWSEYWRVCKGAVVLTAAQPFTSALVLSCPDRFKYGWVWIKSKATGFFNAKRQPLRTHEDVLIFYKTSSMYNPQMTDADPSKIDKRITINNSIIKDGIYSRKGRINKTNNRSKDSGKRYPQTALFFPIESSKIHPTQKPVALFEYLIRTYTNPGDVVMDNCIGSGTTAIAAENTGRRWIGIERDFDYFMKAWQRIMAHDV